VGKIKILGGAPVFNWHEIRKRKRKGSKTRPHSSPDPSCGREESRGGAIPFPQKNSLPRRVQISFQGFPQKMFELRSKNTATIISKISAPRGYLFFLFLGLPKNLPENGLRQKRPQSAGGQRQQ